jgi:hypothetical protein
MGLFSFVRGAAMCGGLMDQRIAASCHAGTIVCAIPLEKVVLKMQAFPASYIGMSYLEIAVSPDRSISQGERK